MRKFILFILLVIISFNSFACSICGCGGGNLYFGLLPNFKNRFIGVRYHYAEYHTQLANDPTQFSTNHYNSTEIWGGFNIGKKFKVLGFIPYYSNKQVDDDGTTYKNGLGDITLIAQYKLLDIVRNASGNKVLQQQLWVGGGIKLPTGSFNVNVKDTSTTIADINAQLGTGSIDFLLNGLYTISVGNIGVNTSATYKINTLNNDNYKYGNKFTANCIAYYKIAANKNTISPNLGVGYESVTGNMLNGTKVQYTGSHVTTALAGIEFSFTKIGLGLNAQIPMEQNFAEGQTKLRCKAMAHITFSL
jgi:hypothetical protein